VNILASSEYDSNHYNYDAVQALRGPKVSWSSAKFNAEDYVPQWLKLEFNEPRKIESISFQATKKTLLSSTSYRF
jgi:hypothetical protein